MTSAGHSRWRVLLSIAVVILTLVCYVEGVNVRVEGRGGGEEDSDPPRQVSDPPEPGQEGAEGPDSYRPESPYELTGGPAEEHISQIETQAARKAKLRPKVTVHRSMPKSEHLKNGLVHLVDKVGRDRYLFRGNLPKTTGADGKPAFAMQELNDTFKALAPTLNHNYFVVVLCLLDPSKNTPGQDEVKHIEMEERYFAQHPHSGLVINWPTRGTDYDPYHTPEFHDCIRMARLNRKCERILYNVQTDMLESRVRKIHKLMYSAPQALLDIGRSPSAAQPPEIEKILRQVEQTGRDIVIYFHCEHGVDRTGETAAAYQMRYKQVSYQNAVHIANQIAIGLPMQIQYKNELQWYCWYLYAQGKMPGGCADREGEIPPRPR